MRQQFLSLIDVYFARNTIQPHIRRTPLVASPPLSVQTRSNIYIKLENLQETGSFKLRGATNKILSLSNEEMARGVITVSSGNHGRAVSYITKKIGVKAVICVPESVPDNKREAIQALGAELIVAGKDADEAMVIADEMRDKRKMTMVHPFDDLDIIAGQGTIGLEIVEDFPELDILIVPLSGGGLMSGIAFTVKSALPSVKVVGVSMERGAAMIESLKAGKVVDIVEEETLADALAGGLNRNNRFTFPLVREYVDETLVVSEEEIANGIWYCLSKHNQVVEGGAAVGVAALLANKVQLTGKNVAVVISGANISMQILNSIISERVEGK